MRTLREVAMTLRGVAEHARRVTGLTVTLRETELGEWLTLESSGPGRGSLTVVLDPAAGASPYYTLSAAGLDALRARLRELESVVAVLDLERGGQ